MSTGTPLMQVDSLSKVFITEDVETHALTNITFDVPPNEFLMILGASGCGKTTLLSILAMLDTTTSGTYFFEGRLVNKLNREERTKLRNERVGFIFQNFNLLGHLTVHQNVMLPMTWRPISRSERKNRAMTALEQVGLSHRANHFPSQLSGGQQQRVSVARAIAGDPAVILADEPTGNLDSKNATAIMELLHTLHSKGRTIIMVTHQPDFGKGVTRALHLQDGRIVSQAAQSARASGELVNTRV